MTNQNKAYGFLLLFIFLISLNILFVQAGTLKVTEEHPFLVNGSWISASELKVGDVLETIDGKKVRITSLEDIVSSENFSVYNLEAGVYHDFVVCGEDGCSDDSLGVVVHNSDAVKGAIYDREAIKRSLARTGSNQIYIDEWSAAVDSIRFDGPISNQDFARMMRWELMPKRYKIALKMKDKSFIKNTLGTYSSEWDYANYRIGSASTVTSPNGEYADLYKMARNTLDTNPALVKRSGADYDLILGHLGESPEKVTGVYFRTEKITVDGEEFLVRTNILLEKSTGQIVVVNTLGSPSEIMRHLGRLHTQILDNSFSIQQRQRALFEMEWWMAQTNPMGRGGASFTQAIDVIYRRELGLPLRKGFEDIDFFALTSPKEGFITQGIDSLKYPSVQN
jgi:hypothetical protein